MDKPKSKHGERFVKVKAIIKTWTEVESIIEYDTYYQQFIIFNVIVRFYNGIMFKNVMIMNNSQFDNSDVKPIKTETVYTCDNCPHAGDLMCCHNCSNFLKI